jgi:hypothetical protein
MVNIDLILNKEYSNDNYEVELELVIFDDYKIPYSYNTSKTSFTSDGEKYNYDKTTLDSDSFSSDENIIEDLIENGIFIIKNIEIVETYKKQTYIEYDEDFDDPRLKYDNYHPHSVINQNINDNHKRKDAFDKEQIINKYVTDKKFINKLLCEKKHNNGELLHNYRLIQDSHSDF